MYILFVVFECLFAIFELYFMIKIKNPIWLSISVSAQLAGLNSKTIRRAIQSNDLEYKIIENRYLIDLQALLSYLHSKKRLKNKFNEFGLGQYMTSHSA